MVMIRVTCVFTFRNFRSVQSNKWEKSSGKTPWSFKRSNTYFLILTDGGMVTRPLRRRRCHRAVGVGWRRPLHQFVLSYSSRLSYRWITSLWSQFPHLLPRPTTHSPFPSACAALWVNKPAVFTKQSTCNCSRLISFIAEDTFSLTNSLSFICWLKHQRSIAYQSSCIFLSLYSYSWRCWPRLSHAYHLASRDVIDHAWA